MKSGGIAMDNKNNGLVSNSIVALIIALGLIASSAIVSNSLIEIKGAKNSIIVTGSAKQQIKIGRAHV